MGLPSDFFAAPPPPGADERTLLATEAWGQVARLFFFQKENHDAVAKDLGVVPADLISLIHIPPGEGISQRVLADHWSCDPSWVTNRIDRLEELGLAERRLCPTDRRVKEVWLTTAGDALRAQAVAAFSRPPGPLTTLDLDDLRELAALLGKLDLGATSPS